VKRDSSAAREIALEIFALDSAYCIEFFAFEFLAKLKIARDFAKVPQLLARTCTIQIRFTRF